MHTGQYISGVGHLALIGWVFLGGVFRSDPPPLEVSEVSVITGAQFEAMLAAQRPPDQVTEVAQPEAPEVTADEPEVVASEDTAIEQPAPVQTEAPSEDATPEVVEETPPQQAEVTDEAPTLDPVGDVAVLTPNVAPEAAPRPVERVAPEPVAQPDPEAALDIDQQEAVAPDETGETTEEPQEATAPEEATTEIATEATAAPAQSIRPPGRRPAAPPRRTAEVAEDPSEDADADADAIAAAVAAAQETAAEPAAPSGPPLNVGEKENLRVAVSNCWNVDVGGRSSDTIVTVGVSMGRDGKVSGDVRLISADGGDAASQRTAFQAARRAILRCQEDGYPLPAEKYDHWKEIEMTFNPERMRVK